MTTSVLQHLVVNDGQVSRDQFCKARVSQVPERKALDRLTVLEDGSVRDLNAVALVGD